MKEKVTTMRFIVSILLGLLAFSTLFYLERFMAVGGLFATLADDLTVPYNYSFEVIVFILSLLLAFVISGGSFKKRMLAVLITLIGITLILSLTIFL